MTVCAGMLGYDICHRGPYPCEDALLDMLGPDTVILTHVQLAVMKRAGGDEVVHAEVYITRRPDAEGGDLYLTRYVIWRMA